MKFKRQRRFEAEVATASLNDIMFFLLLFFLIISTLANPNVIKLLLPKAAASQSVSKQPVTLSITKEKVYFINRTPVPFPQLEARLRAATANMPEPTIVLRAESSLTIQDLVDVMSLGAKMKLRMVLATELGK